VGAKFGEMGPKKFPKLPKKKTLFGGKKWWPGGPFRPTLAGAKVFTGSPFGKLPGGEKLSRLRKKFGKPPLKKKPCS